MLRSFARHSASIYDRYFFLATASVVYVALAALQHTRGQPGPLAVAALAPLLLTLVWRHGASKLGLDAGEVHPASVSALRVAAWGSALWAAASTGPAAEAAFALAANIGVGCALGAAASSLARIPERSGLAQPGGAARSLDAAVVCALVWGLASALPAARLVPDWQGPLLEPAATALVTSAASVAGLVVLAAAAWRLRASRRLELGVAERSSAALAITLVAALTAAPLAGLGVARVERVLPIGVLVAAVGCCWSAAARAPTSLARLMRAGLAVVAIGAPIALGAAAVAARWTSFAGVVAFAGCALAVVAGAVASAAARPFAAETQRWLEGLARAGQASLAPEPEAGIAAALAALQQLELEKPTRPALWRVQPPQRLGVDVAGYVRAEPGAAPADVYELARAEPEQILRREVLEALQVRRPEVRPALAWLDEQDAAAAVLLEEEHSPLGLLILPRGSRRRPLTLEEARAARGLAERLRSLLAQSSSLERLRERERDAEQRAQLLQAENAELAARVAQVTRPHEPLAEALASEARVAAYGRRARSTFEELERHARSAADVLLEAPLGADVIGYGCVFHVASARRAGPLVVADGAAAATQSVAHWEHETESPCARAAGGTLLLLNAAALPLAVQDALAIRLSKRAAEARSAPPFALVAVVGEAPAMLLARRELSRAFAQLLSPHALALPALRERPEDLRALVLHHACRSGARHEGAPLGVEPRALSLLIEHPWPGNDAELRLVVEGAARRARGPRITVADLVASGFAVQGESATGARSAVARTSVPEREGGSESVRAPLGSSPPSSELPRRMRSEIRRAQERDAEAATGSEAATAADAATAPAAADASPRPVTRRRRRR